MENKIIILGSGTCNHEIKKANTSLLICVNDTKIVYDFGYRVYYRLKQLGFSNNDIDSIIISHFHPDHFSDLIPFLHSSIFSKFPRKKSLNIYSSEYGVKFLNIINELLLKPDKFKKLINLTIIENNNSIKIENVLFKFKKFSHFLNLAVRFEVNNKIITISGDIDFYKDDLSFFKDSYYCFFNLGNISLNNAIEFSKNQNIEHLIILHSYQNNLTSKNNIIIGKDLMEFQL